MTTPINLFKTRLAAGETQIGLWLGLANPYTAEICAGAGFDWLLLDAEHAPNDVRSLLAQLQALAPYDAAPVIRPPIGDRVLIKQLLDIGAQTILAPMVESAEQARHLVASMRYPPLGARGVGSALARASRWQKVDRYLQTADEQMCLLVQVETLAGLENLEAIARTPGVDGVFIGPADLAGALGHLGDTGHPEVQSAISHAIAVIRSCGKAAGILYADREMARRYIELGCGFVAVGVDTTLLSRAASDLAGAFRTGGSTAPSETSSPY